MAKVARRDELGARAAMEAIRRHGDLRAAYRRIVDLLAKGDEEDVLCRHQVGLIVREIMTGADKYGTSGVELLADALGRDASTLYEYAKVAEAWPTADVQKIMKRRSESGVPLSFSHLVVLAGVAAAERSALVSMALAEGLSVRALRERCGGPRHRGDDAVVEVGGDTRDAVASLEEIVAWARKSGARAAALRDRLASLGRTSSTPALRALVLSSLDEEQKLEKQCHETVEFLRRELERVESDLRTSGAPSRPARAAAR